MNKTNNTTQSSKIGSSIGFQLGTRLFFRLFAILLSLDLLICCLTCVSLVIYSERTAATLAELLEARENGPAIWEDVPQVSGAVIDTVVGEPTGIHIIKPFSYLLADATQDARRMVEMSGSLEDSFWQRLDSLQYQVSFGNGGYTTRISVKLGLFLHYFRFAFIILLGFELLTLLSRLSKDRKLVRETLSPISELTQAARNLNQADGQFDPDKMAALAGKLEGINASRLDTRIPVDETQTELKSLAVAINSMLDRINASYRAQVRFVSDASHELRTPISVIQGYANLLDRWGKNDEKTLQESIVAIKDEAANMKDLVEQLLFLARGDNNTIRLTPECVNLHELADEVIHETQLIDSTHRFSVRAVDAIVNADRALVKQALRILVDNAIKYTDAGGSITVTVETEGDFTKLSVTDDGMGIGPEVVPQIFDRFYRADESRARATGGAGLGLSIAKWIATRHGGHMEVLSRVGIGTKVIIAFPAGTQLPAPEKSEPEPEQ